ncbi:MAG: class I SAM-dependent methyltransferase [Ignavibacteriales bacterium]|nr:class I SAM-dependent methyltransferase [Ignavibacteriales bacterium]
MSNSASCHYCGSSRIVEIVDFSGLHRVTSDCKPWRSGGRLGWCQDCGFPQTIIDDAWRAEVSLIYNNFTVYHQSNGLEQSVFDLVTGKPNLRSDYLLQKLSSELDLDSVGHLLDVGAGNGNFLKAFHRIRPNWNLSASEWDDKGLPDLKQIPRFIQLYTGEFKHIGDTFDLLSLIHTLEHLPQPLATLCTLRGLIKPDGFIFIQVPDCSINPFALLVADHCSHFNLSSLRILIEAAGFEVITANNQWIPKEISLLARPKTHQTRLHLPQEQSQYLIHHVNWIKLIVHQAKQVAASRSLGIFGTSVAATWLWSELISQVKFFVDEDPSRLGRTHCGLPILTPAQVDQDAAVYLCLAPKVAETVQARLSSQIPHIIMPPSFSNGY